MASPGEPHPIDKAFYDLTVKERDYERARCDRLTAERDAALAAALREDDGERVERWMVDYEHGDDEPQHAVLSWLNDEADGLPEVGTTLVRASDYDRLHARALRAEAAAAAPREDEGLREALEKIAALVPTRVFIPTAFGGFLREPATLADAVSVAQAALAAASPVASREDEGEG